ncbi:MAG: undecaprenyl-diphosphate phosphatase [Candidatus Diapherotrites archaeon]
MDFFQALVLGLVQGLVEWLPLSSQGQVMAISMSFFGITPAEAIRIAVFLHIGTFFAALYYFRKEAIQIIFFKEKPLAKFLFIALLSTLVTGIPCYFLLKTVLSEFNPAIILIIISALLFIMGLIQWRKKFQKKARLSKKNAFFLGLGQGFAVLPGISRSGITTSTLLFEGFSPEQAFRISFLLSIPSVFLADIAFGFTEGFSFSPEAVFALAIAAITGFLSISALLKIAKKINFSFFCFFFGAIYALLAVSWLL